MRGLDRVKHNAGREDAEVRRQRVIAHQRTEELYMWAGVGRGGKEGDNANAPLGDDCEVKRRTD